MSSLKQILISGESPVFETKLHWIVFSAPAIYALFGSVALVNHSSSLGWIFVLLGVIGLLVASINYLRSEFGVTNKRVFIRTGFTRRRSLEMGKVASMGVRQGIWARMFGYGTIVISRTGGTKEKLHNIKAPLEFRKQVQKQIAAETSSPGAGSAAD